MINILQKKNKKAATMQSWTEGIGLMVAFVIVFGVIIAGMNSLYSKDYNVEGLETDTFESALETYQASQQEKLHGGEASFTSAVGLTVSTSWDVVTSTLSLVWNFITGQWIQTILVDYLHLGEIGITLAFILRGLLFIAVGFIVLRILFKVKS